MNIFHGRCEEVLPSIQDNSVDAVICDPPYGTTACGWDSIINFAFMWSQIKRVAKKNAALVLTASQPFTSLLVTSNLSDFKYSWVWDKKRVSNPQLAKYQPLKVHEDVCVFSNGGGATLYNPQGVFEVNIERKKDTSNIGHCKRKDYVQTVSNYPKSIQRFRFEQGFHPTQKPVGLMEFLIRTYTNKGDVVLDFSMGSGTTGVACINTDRAFIGIEKEKEYFDIARQRIRDAKQENLQRVCRLPISA